ncbi:MAG TPA: GAF domain-containing sensor histidine kinase [Kofleriaceae bacterium]|nr:GAF domain-containing sensor histidine kinase [Kofleriaceae bacterium]
MERSFAGPAETRPDAIEIDLLYRSLQRASNSVVSLFDEHMRHDEQIEKRYTRLLREVAVEALHAGEPALRTGLQQLLDIVMEAMKAQSAAILLRNGETHLVTVATAGAEPLEEYATTIGAGSFASMIAESGEPTTLWDVTSTKLEVPDALRRSGIHGLLGVQLKSRSGLLGVIYVGSAESRGFTPSESRMLETLAEHLVAHLDTVLLLERLSATIAALRTEQSIREHFVSVLAHDLRGPLSAAKLAAQMLSQEPASLDARRDLAVRIDRNLDRLDRMIRDLLDANRIRAGERLPLRLDTCDLGRVANEVVEELRVLHGDHFVIDARDRVLGIWSADELRRALWNLGSNAVKYGALDRPITFVVRREGERAFASVHNWGTPIPDDIQAHIFEPFARTSNAVQSGQPGWGLGLTLVRGSAEAHGGRVSLASSAQEGTTFTIEVPLDARPYQNVAVSSVQVPATTVH